MKKMIVLAVLLITAGCTNASVNRAVLPADDFLVIAHRGASAYAPAHTLSAYEIAVQMGTDYIELDLHMTKDGKLVALHDTVISIQDAEQSVADVTLDELRLYSPGKEFNEENPQYASSAYEELHVVELKEVLLYFGRDANYYIELKSPVSYPGIEHELLRQLRAHYLLNRDDELPKVIIQSFNEDSLKRIYELEPSIPLIKLYTFDKDARLSKNELRNLTNYASGVGLNADTVTRAFVESMHKEGLDVHPFTVNDEDMIRTLMALGVDGIFTDKPDVAVRLRDESNTP